MAESPGPGRMDGGNHRCLTSGIGGNHRRLASGWRITRLGPVSWWLDGNLARGSCSLSQNGGFSYSLRPVLLSVNRPDPKMADGMAIEPGDSGVNLGFGVVQSADGIKASGMCPKSRKRKGPRSDLFL